MLGNGSLENNNLYNISKHITKKFTYINFLKYYFTQSPVI